MDDWANRSKEELEGLWPIYEQIKKSSRDSINRSYNKKDVQHDIEENTLKTPPVDVALIVAVQNEREGVYHAFNILSTPDKHRELFRKYRIEYEYFTCDGVKIALLIQSSMGMTQAASLATRAILGLQPKLVAMVGICAGREDKSALGDIVIASSVYDYTAGKYYANHFGPRAYPYRTYSGLSTYITGSVIHNLGLVAKIKSDYHGDRPKNEIDIRYGIIGTGTSVIDDSKKMEEIIRDQDDLIGIDMEAYALAAAAEDLDTKWIVIKSVQDFANGNKSSSESGVRNFAAYSSAKLFQLIVKELLEYL